MIDGEAKTGALRALAAGMIAGLIAAASAPATAADIIRGNRIYAAHCAVCHGVSGLSVMPGAPNLARGSDRLMQADVGLLASIRSGKNAMPAYIGVLTDREILDVIAYLRTLR